MVMATIRGFVGRFVESFSHLIPSEADEALVVLGPVPGRHHEVGLKVRLPRHLEVVEKIYPIFSFLLY